MTYTDICRMMQKNAEDYGPLPPYGGQNTMGQSRQLLTAYEQGRISAIAAESAATELGNYALVAEFKPHADRERAEIAAAVQAAPPAQKLEANGGDITSIARNNAIARGKAIAKGNELRDAADLKSVRQWGGYGAGVGAITGGGLSTWLTHNKGLSPAKRLAIILASTLGGAGVGAAVGGGTRAYLNARKRNA